MSYDIIVNVMQEIELNGLDTLTDSRFYYRQCMLQLMVERWSWELFCDEHITVDMSFPEYIVCGAEVEDQFFNYQYAWSPDWSANDSAEDEAPESPVFDACAGAA